MFRTNQNGDPVTREILYGFGMPGVSGHITNNDRDVAIALLAERLQVMVVRTNATKHGTTELVLEEVE